MEEDRAVEREGGKGVRTAARRERVINPRLLCPRGTSRSIVLHVAPRAGAALWGTASEADAYAEVEAQDDSVTAHASGAALIHRRTRQRMVFCAFPEF